MADIVLTVRFQFHSAANRKPAKMFANLPVIISLLTCEIRLHLSKFFCYSNLRVSCKQLFETSLDSGRVVQDLAFDLVHYYSFRPQRLWCDILK